MYSQHSGFGNSQAGAHEENHADSSKANVHVFPGSWGQVQKSRMDTLALIHS